MIELSPGTTDLSNVESNRNLVDSSQWDASWKTATAPKLIRAWRDYVSWRYTRFFPKYIKPNDKVMEVGCGGSRFLPYFAKNLQAQVFGFDYTPQGVATSKAALAYAGVGGTILQADLFGEPAFPLHYFDVVYSGGFIEHFTDTRDVVKRIVDYAKPGHGLIITVVPNVAGWVGEIQKRIDPELYQQHVALTPRQIDEAHLSAGARAVLPAEYFGTVSLGVVNYNRILKRMPGPVAKASLVFLQAMQMTITAPVWVARTRFETAAISPFVIGVYQRL